MKKYLAKTWHLILAGIALTAFAVPHTYSTRGYFAIGGEWLILPVILMMEFLAEIAIQEIFFIAGFKDGDDK